MSRSRKRSFPTASRGRYRILPGCPTTTRLGPGTLQAQARKEDGSIVGQGTYAVSHDGGLMTATSAGFDTQLRSFQTRTVWDRVD